MKGRAIPYSTEEMAWLEQNRMLPIAEYHAGFCARFGRGDASKINLHSLRKRMGWKTGRTGRFEPGQESWNKGKTCPEGKGGRHPNSRRTQFKPGNRTGRANHVWKPVGTERLSKEGYREIKVHEGLPMQSRWQLLQRVEWEKVNGPIPAGHALKCLDGDKLNCSPENWECIPRGVLARLNGGNRHHRTLAYDDAAPEVKPLVMASAKLKHAAVQAGKT